MTKQAIANFSAGPAQVPHAVLEQAQQEFINWYHGMSVMEISHRTGPVLDMQANIQSLLRTLLAIPDDFSILLMHGGARGQFSAVPMNLLPSQGVAHYLVTGYWGALAAKVASDFGTIDTTTIQSVSDLETWKQQAEFAYVHLTDNETIEGIELPFLPEVQCPIVMDLTSNILTRPIDWQKVHCVYASAQKNLGIAGVTFVIIKQDLIDETRKVVPDILSYHQMQQSNSMLNTPSVFAWYMADKVLTWVHEQGGVAAMADLAQQKSQLLYHVIDQSEYYSNDIAPNWRSRMNVPFRLESPELFFEQAKEAGFYFLEGHRSQGGARASLYNGMSLGQVEALVAFMQAFEKRNG